MRTSAAPGRRPAVTAAALAAGAAALAAGAAACLALAAGPAAAQDGDGDGRPGGDSQAWSVQPADQDGADGRASFDYQGPAGESVDDYVQVNNFSEQPLTLQVYSQDAVNTPAGGYTLLPGDQQPTDVGAWVGLDQQVTVPAQDHVVVPFTLTVPPDATPGDHPGGIVAAAATEATDQQGNPVLVDHRVGARIHLRVDGELNPALQVSDQRASYAAPKLPFTAGEVTVTYTVTNTGNLRLQAEQELTVRGPFGLGARTTTLDRLPELLPGQSMTTTAQLDGLAPLLLLSSDLTLRPVPPLAADPTGQPATAQATTWALPWRELLAVVLVALAVWGLWWHRRRRRRREASTLAEAVAKARREALQEARRNESGHQETTENQTADGDGPRRSGVAERGGHDSS